MVRSGRVLANEVNRHGPRYPVGVGVVSFTEPDAFPQAPFDPFLEVTGECAAIWCRPDPAVMDLVPGDTRWMVWHEVKQGGELVGRDFHLGQSFTDGKSRC